MSYFSGRVHSVVYENPDNAFYILKMVLDDATGGPVSVKGTVPGVKITDGAWFGFEGKWDNHKEYGRQLAITRAPVIQGGWDADTACKTLVANGVGPQVMQSIREHFGDADLLKALEDSTRLEDVPGISKFSALHVVSRWVSVQAHFKVLEFLANLGLPPGIVRSIWTHFGDDAEMVLATNPWALVEVGGITFGHAEEVARRSGLNDPAAQMRGAVLYACKANRAFGHMYLRTGHILQMVQGYLADVTQEMVLEALMGLHKDGLLVIDRKTRPKTVAVYEPWSYEMEKRSAELILQRHQSARYVEGDERTEKYLKDLGSVGPLTQEAGSWSVMAERLDKVVRAAVVDWGNQAHLVLSEPQKEGIIHALTAPVSVLSGLPGTGKCVVPSTLVSGPWGMSPIGDLAPEDAPEGVFHPFSLMLDTSEGPREGTDIFNGGVKKTVRITTQDGYALEGTPEHPIRVVAGGEHQWKTLGDVLVGDVPVLFRGGCPLDLTPGCRLDLRWTLVGRPTPSPRR